MCKVSPASCLVLVILTRHIRCTAKKSDLDGDLTGIARSHEHTDICINTFDGDLDILWDAYGIIGNIIVSQPALYLFHSNTAISHLPPRSLVLISTSSSRPTSYIKSSRGRSKITLLAGSPDISNSPTVKPQQKSFLLILTVGKSTNLLYVVKILLTV